MTNYRDYGYRKKPIRKDRVAIVALFVLVVILLPILLHSGRPGNEAPLTVVEQGGTETAVTLPSEGTTAGGEETTTTPVSAAESESALPSGVLTHVVSDGETIAEVADDLRVSVENLRASNRFYDDEPLQPGDLVYGSAEGVVHTVQPGQTLTDIAITYSVPIESIAQANGITDPSKIYAGERILIPGVTKTFWDDVVKLSKGKHTQFIWPLQGEVVSGFGWRTHPVLGTWHHHNGIDIDVPEGTIVHAGGSGKVYFTGEQEGYGTTIIIEHPNDFYTIYGHLSVVYVHQGQFVEVGQEIAESGNTGISSGPHLHFEIRNGEFPVDPIRYLP